MNETPSMSVEDALANVEQCCPLIPASLALLTGIDQVHVTPTPCTCTCTEDAYVMHTVDITCTCTLSEVPLVFRHKVSAGVQVHYNCVLVIHYMML